MTRRVLVALALLLVAIVALAVQPPRLVDRAEIDPSEARP